MLSTCLMIVLSAFWTAFGCHILGFHFIRTPFPLFSVWREREHTHFKGAQRCTCQLLACDFVALCSMFVFALRFFFACVWYWCLLGPVYSSLFCFICLFVLSFVSLHFLSFVGHLHISSCRVGVCKSKSAANDTSLLYDATEELTPAQTFSFYIIFALLFSVNAFCIHHICNIKSFVARTHFLFFFHRCCDCIWQTVFIIL